MAPTDESKVKPFPGPAPLFAAQQPDIPEPGPSGVQMLRMAMEIAAARSLLLIALIGAVLMFGYAVYDPAPWRLYAVATYSAVALWPLVYLALKRA